MYNLLMSALACICSFVSLHAQIIAICHLYQEQCRLSNVIQT